MRTLLVFLADVDFDNSPHVRAETRQDLITEYAEAYKAKEGMAPPDLFKIQGSPHLLIGDGRHRLLAAKEIGLKQLACSVHDGSVDDCVMFALGSNRTHGLRRSTQDKHACVHTAIGRFPKYSDNRIAEACHVSNHLVADIRKEMETNGHVKPEPTRECADNVARPAKQTVRAAAKSDLENSKSPDVMQASEQIKAALSPVPVVTAPHEPNGHHVLDEEGYPLSRLAVRYWERRDEIQKILSAISLLKGQLMKWGESRDPMYYGISFNRALDGISDVYHNVANAKPYALCTECEGHPEVKAGHHCAMCGGKGLISKFAWETLVPQEKKDLRTKMVEARARK